MKNYDTNILIFGIGNSGRSDDGLGWAFLDAVKDDLPENYDIEYRYQLQVEDAELISHYDVIYFVDAHVSAFKKGYTFYRCEPKTPKSISSHELDPETVLRLAIDIYNKEPVAHILGISGDHFALELGLSKIAEENLKNALAFFNQKVLQLVV
ncbi:MAG: hydrogenase maturation protease [Muriicola sp.]|nr:hydrogenase maturation protease [Muriicola sp.]